jgi:hypothetical protein
MPRVKYSVAFGATFVASLASVGFWMYTSTGETIQGPRAEIRQNGFERNRIVGGGCDFASR